MNKFLFISVVLDPRHKLQFLVYMLKDMYGYEVGGAMRKDVEATILSLVLVLDELHNHYLEYKLYLNTINQ